MKKQTSKQLTATDPVCGMEVSYKTAIEDYEYKGKTYYFCAGVCREKFETDPEQYIGHHRQH
tara:strand:- start:4856 stop:5041 length:186 start_codon:yes stop_codon:yes gene_type:complete